MSSSLGPNTNAMTREETFQHGVSLYQHQKKKEARKVFEQLLCFSPGSLPLLQVLAVLDNEEGLWQAAIGKLDTALMYEPNNASILFDKALVLTQQGINNDALRLVEQLLSVAPDNQDVLSLRQKLTITIGKHGESRRTAKQKKQLKTQRDLAIKEEVNETLKLANHMANSGNKEEAKHLFQAVLSVAGELPKALFGLAKLQIDEEQYALARQTLLRGFDPKRPEKDTLILLTHSEINIGEYKTAREYAKQGCSIWPEEAFFCRLLIQSYEKENNWLEAYRVAKEVIRLFPNDEDILYRLATSGFNLLRARHHFTSASIVECQAHIELAKKVAHDANKVRLSTHLAEVLWYKGEAKKAKSILEAYLEIFPDDIEVGFNISFIYRTLNEWEKYYRANELGLTCGRRLKYQGDMPQWSLNRPKSDTVLVMPEQGVGDELLYFHNLSLVLEHSKKVYVACDPRLKKILSHAYPDAIMVPITRIENEQIQIPKKVINDITSWVAGGSLAAQCFALYGRHVYQSGYIKLPNKIKEHWSATLNQIRDNNPEALLIGLCWRSGLAGATRNIHYLVPDEVSHLMKQIPNAIFINLQYGDCTKERHKIEKRSGVKLIQLDGLDLRDDFEATAAVIASLDLVISAGTAVHRLTTAVGTPCHVFFAGTDESDFTVPQSLYCENELGYFYPPLMANKYPMLESIAKQIVKRAAVRQ